MLCACLALNPDLPQIVIRDLNAQAFPVVDEAVTLGMTYGLAFETASIIFRMRISKMQNAMDQYRLVWQSDLSVKAKTEKMNALVWRRADGVCTCSRFCPPSNKKSMPPKLGISAAY